jgi:hypothetical protein
MEGNYAKANDQEKEERRKNDTYTYAVWECINLRRDKNT